MWPNNFPILPLGAQKSRVVARLSTCPWNAALSSTLTQLLKLNIQVHTLQSVHQELKISPDCQEHSSRENELSRRVCSVIAELKLLLIEFDSSVDVLVIGAGPTGLGAAKRLNQLVRKSPYIRASIDLMSYAERVLMDDR